MKQSAKLKPKRKAIGTRKRFDIFKRDNFTCQYCGKRTPEVVLHCDHIVPVAEGGTNDPVNLVTSCQECNFGKSDVPLDQKPPPLRHTQETERERWNQFKALNEYLAEKARDISEWTRRASQYFVYMCGRNPEEFTLPPTHMASIKHFAQRLPLAELMDAIDVTFSHNVKEQDRFRYFCGVCWNKIRKPCQGENVCHSAS